MSHAIQLPEPSKVDYTLREHLYISQEFHHAKRALEKAGVNIIQVTFNAYKDSSTVESDFLLHNRVLWNVAVDRQATMRYEDQKRMRLVNLYYTILHLIKG